MANLTFRRENNEYVAEFTATADFNIHIEKENPGLLVIYQRGVSEGNYAEVIGARKYVYDNVYDVDFTTYVYPKYIKIVSSTNITSAEVTYNK